LAPIVHMKNCV